MSQNQVLPVANRHSLLFLARQELRPPTKFRRLKSALKERVINYELKPVA
ncbi:hypothetical protein Q2T83_02750 [Fervidibacter sacchari]|uniref:Uncharacterized protein n=1 Tax=Candidatus Fervidibacter sacchari TaxID=1448929 RepID=A0ABT2EPX9_9BACT|nr:hypothetical protein [Candidatus Fervidibacter sacchari]MCS3920015.1 hypothetical protein [Candidatus Fervidibacter sacchari]WKU16751.1 hypothetical protein Q2T83_02750 [Candidatus Fervidibacter sacchari]